MCSGARRPGDRASVRATLLVALAVMLVTGCAFIDSGRDGRQAPGATPVTEDASGEAAALDLLRYANGLRVLAASQLEAERLRAESDLETRWSAGAALRVSLLLTTPAAEVRDDARARALLQRVEAGAPDARPAEAELARFLLALLADQEGAVVAAAGDGSGAAHAREVDSLRRALAAERTRRGELEQQVQALKQLEQNLSQRPNAVD